MGIVDQFTDVAVFPDLCMDTMLPPGMLRNKTLGLDKSLMGLEMCGGGGHTTTQVENKYDDQWIKNTFKDYTKKYKAYTKGQHAQDKLIGRKANKADVAKQLDTKAGKDWTKKSLEDLNKQLTQDFNQQFADLNIGDIAGLDDQLTSIFQQSELSDKELMDQLSTVKETYADKGYVGSALSGLEESLSSDFGTQLSGVQSELSGDISALGTDFASKLSESEKTGAQNLADVKAALETDYGGQITDLSDTFGTKIGAVSDQLASAEADLATHKSDTETQFSNVADQYAGLSSDLSDLGTDTSARFAKAYDDANLMYDVIDDDISDLDIKFGTELGEAKDHMASQLKATDEALNKRLTDISKSMNYRMLGNTATGVKIRRSKAFKGGNTFKGTSQLGRTMKIGTLNI
jgi:hypothetical protein